MMGFFPLLCVCVCVFLLYLGSESNSETSFGDDRIKDNRNVLVNDSFCLAV